MIPALLADVVPAPASGAEQIKDTVFTLVLVVTICAIAWFALKATATRGSPRAVRMYHRLDPQVQTLRRWMSTSPVTVVYVSAWTATTIIIQGAPADLASLFDRFNSTNLLGVLTSPLRVLLSSALIVADNGFLFIGYLVVYFLITARLEQRIGSARVIVVGVAAHGLGSLITVGIEAILIHNDEMARSMAVTADVGVSYVMVGTAAGYLLFVGHTWRWWYVAALVLGLVVPVFVERDIWSLGHLIAASIGLATTAIVRRFGVRPPLRWRDIASDSKPRQLPTWA